MMKKIRMNALKIGAVALIPFLAISCEKFFNPDQVLNITEDKLYDDWYEYRAVEMGMYGLQQKLVEQLFMLGELRGDLVNITETATADMTEVYNFNISRTNKYADPTNFFKLISACNNFIRILEREHPEVKDPEAQINNYDRLYGEALCMRAWAYFNAVRIYGKVPYIYESLTTYDEIESYVNSSGTYTDSIYIVFNTDGYHNDTLQNVPTELEKQYYDLELVIDIFTNQLENRVKAVGVNHYVDNNDISWEVTVWNTWAMHALLGHMYLNQGDYVKAADHFEQIIFNASENNRYQLDIAFGYGNWRNIFQNVDSREHIYTLWFNKANFQQNPFQSYFEPWSPHKYMMKPTYKSILLWETVWRSQVYILNNDNPNLTRMAYPGVPSDYYRGIFSSYIYVRNGVPITEQQYEDMLVLRANEDIRSSEAIMEGMDTVIFKYSVGKGLFDQDANYIIYRASAIHLYLAEIYTYWVDLRGGLERTDTETAIGLVNNGSPYSLDPTRDQLGVRGRVGLGGSSDGINVGNINYIHDPFTNEITGYIDLSGNFAGKQLYLEDRIMDERARELAFEGERFYDLVRVAKRRNNPAYLAKAVSGKFPANQRDAIYNLLLDEENWYVNYFNE